MDNTQPNRAASRASIALTAAGYENDETGMQDLITDLMHMAKKENIDFFRIENSAALNYNGELQDNGPADPQDPPVSCQCKSAELVNKIATLTTPEQEFSDPEFNHDFDDVDEYVCEMIDERLFGEYYAFMEMVREAKEIVK